MSVICIDKYAQINIIYEMNTHSRDASHIIVLYNCHIIYTEKTHSLQWKYMSCLKQSNTFMYCK
jgi:hypothetical protein